MGVPSRMVCRVGGLGRMGVALMRYVVLVRWEGDKVWRRLHGVASASEAMALVVACRRAIMGTTTRIERFGQLTVVG